MPLVPRPLASVPLMMAGLLRRWLTLRARDAKASRSQTNFRVLKDDHVALANR